MREAVSRSLDLPTLGSASEGGDATVWRVNDQRRPVTEIPLTIQNWL